MTESYPAYLFKKNDVSVETTVFWLRDFYDVETAKEKWLETISHSLGSLLIHSCKHFYLHIYNDSHTKKPLTSPYMSSSDFISYIAKHFSKPESIRLEIDSGFGNKGTHIILVQS